MKLAMKTLHWNETDGIWLLGKLAFIKFLNQFRYDYDLERNAHSNTYYVSNALPLYAKCYDGDDAPGYVDVTPYRVYEYLKVAFSRHWH
jgi:hypothetical protein